MMISSGSISIVILMYSYQINGVLKKKRFISQHMYLAPGVELVLLIMSFSVLMSDVGVPISTA